MKNTIENKEIIYISLNQHRYNKIAQMIEKAIDNNIKETLHINSLFSPTYSNKPIEQHTFTKKRINLAISVYKGDLLHEKHNKRL